MTFLHSLSQPACVALVFAIVAVGWGFVELAYRRFGLGAPGETRQQQARRWSREAEALGNRKR